MKMKRFRYAEILLIILMILPSCSFAGAIDDLLTKIAYPAEKPVEITFKIEAFNLPQFSEIRTGWLNGLLKHITLRIQTDGMIQKEEIHIDETPVLEYVTGKDGESTGTFFSYNDIIYNTDENDPIELLSGITSEKNMIEYYTGFQVLLPELHRFFSGLPEQFPDSVSESKVSIQYKGYGTAVKRYSIVLSQDVLSTEQMAEYLDKEELIHVRQFLSKVVLSGKQRLTLLRDADGNLMKVNYTGKSGLSTESIRNTDLNWKCLKNGNSCKDVLVLKTPAVNGAERHNITLNRESVLKEDGTEEYSCSIDTDEVKNRIRNRIRFDISLQASENVVSGNAVKKTTTSGINDIFEYRISIQPGDPEEYHGSLEIAHELNKIDREHIHADFTFTSCDEPEWTDGESSVPTEKDLQDIREKAAGNFLKALENIPEEDLQYILADLPGNWWTKTINKTEKPEETDQP